MKSKRRPSRKKRPRRRKYRKEPPPPASEQTFAEAPVEEQEAQEPQEPEVLKEELPEAPAEEVPQEAEEETQAIAEDSSEAAPQKVEALAEEETTDDNELEIDDDFRPEDNAVRGGSSGGGGGSSGGSGSGFVGWNRGPAAHTGIVIQKLNEKPQPMSVVFRVTNTTTGESHLVVTDEAEDGYSGTITFSRLALLDWLEIGRAQEWDIQYLNNMTLKPEEKQAKVEKPKIFTRLPAPEPWPDPENENKNDTYKEPGQEKNLYEHAEELIPGGEVRFKEPPKDAKRIRGKITLTISYGDAEQERKSPSDTTNALYNETFTYEGMFADQMNMLNDRALEQFTQKRLAALNQLGLCKVKNKGSVTSSVVFTPEDDTPIEHIYKFEELRTPKNQNYQLETFYVKYSSNGSLLWGKDEKEITTPIDHFIFYPKTTGGHGGGVVFAPQNPNSPRPEDTSASGSEGAFVGYPETPNPGHPVPYPGGDNPPVPPVPYPGGDNPPIPPVPKEYKHNHIGDLLTITNKPIEFNTVATDGKDNKSVEKGENTQVVDKVTYKGLTAGKDYKLIGKIYKKPKSGEVTEDDLVCTKEFEWKNLDSSNGEKDLTFTFNTTDYKEDDEFVIVYEIMEKVVQDGDDNAYVPAGYEKDFQSESQSFTLKGKTTPPPKEEEPKDPPKPEDPPTPEEPPKPEDPPTPEEPPKPEVPHVHVPVKVSMPPVRIPTAGVGR